MIKSIILTQAEPIQSVNLFGLIFAQKVEVMALGLQAGESVALSREVSDNGNIYVAPIVSSWENQTPVEINVDSAGLTISAVQEDSSIVFEAKNTSVSTQIRILILGLGKK